LRIVEVGLAPEGWRDSSGREHESAVLFVCHLSRSEGKTVNPHMMDGTFAILAVLGTHEEIGRWDLDQGGPDLNRGGHLKSV
jgi:hypothetical protein